MFFIILYFFHHLFTRFLRHHLFIDAKPHLLPQKISKNSQYGQKQQLKDKYRTSGPEKSINVNRRHKPSGELKGRGAGPGAEAQTPQLGLYLDSSPATA